MILKFFKKDKKDITNQDEITNVACLLIHVARIDENYSDIEKEIILKTLKNLYVGTDNIDEIVKIAEKKEQNSNHIQEFTKQIKKMSKANKSHIVENLWKIIMSDGKSDIYENNIMRRLAGLLYLDDKTMGEIKTKVKNLSQ
tara:strand:- start:975 stop:1400 length:426 start_codon:yes stop_codon:yes gene_type:complete